MLTRAHMRTPTHTHAHVSTNAGARVSAYAHTHRCICAQAQAHMRTRTRTRRAHTHKHRSLISYLLLQAVDADCHQVAWSGFGVVRNCCGGNRYMPEIYNRTLATVDRGDWQGRADGWQPDAVVINLGTNDGLPPPESNDPVLDSYRTTYQDMLRSVEAWYGQDTVVFLACGPMSGAYCPQVDRIIAENPTRMKLAFLDQRNLIIEGCCGHPSAADNALMAERSTREIREVMGWRE